MLYNYLAVKRTTYDILQWRNAMQMECQTVRLTQNVENYIYIL